MRVEKTIYRKVKVYLLGCDKCKKPIKGRMVRVSFMKAAKGINNRRVWDTTKKVVYCSKCYSH